MCGNDFLNNPYQTIGSVPEYKDLLDGYKSMESARLIRDQLKLILIKFQQTSLNFGLLITPALDDIAVQLSDTFRGQVKEMAALAREYKGADYAGLQKTLPGHLEVKSHAMVIYCGLLYHGRTITDPEKKEKWNKFNVAAGGSTSARYSKNSHIKDAKVTPEEIFAICHMRGSMALGLRITSKSLMAQI
ncbi:Uncharacterized protein FKW44_025125 [Caligus rogercresseyi]|uniref:Uncharacterized protein n=1 Tax=Caligus rogercresseyi TaxID=217165 RepID=A0A7T8GKD2_CALRO|nr:Uncharacterized protein FKW44_025125 [Caligus rogercresseyi]